MGIQKLAHVPVQTWKNWEVDPVSQSPGAPWLKHNLIYLLCGIVLLLLACLIHCLKYAIYRPFAAWRCYIRLSLNSTVIQTVRNYALSHTKLFLLLPCHRGQRSNKL